MQGNKAQLSIVDKVKLPVKIGVQSEYIFDINLKGELVLLLTQICILSL